MYFQELFAEALQEPPMALLYQVSRHLAESHPGRSILEGSDCDFAKLGDFAEAGGCALRLDDSTHQQIAVWWSDERGPVPFPRNAWYQVEWAGESIDVVVMSWSPDESPWHWVIARSPEVARGFYSAVCGHKEEVVGEVLVYDGGRWSGSGRLLREIAGSTFENLILPETLKAEIRADVERFFASKDVYEKYGVPWKRGLLLLGPPGNGKTHAIKALINATGLPCLYIKTFDSEKFEEETGIRQVFRKAREAAPCLLVLEDLDSLVSGENRSFLLNEMDGFSANAGILTIATTNHPGRLDPAILDRPSRFDRKYHFGLPERPERLASIERWAGGAGAGNPAHFGSTSRGRRPDRRVLVRLLERVVPVDTPPQGRRARRPSDGRAPARPGRLTPRADGLDLGREMTAIRAQRRPGSGSARPGQPPGPARGRRPARRGYKPWSRPRQPARTGGPSSPGPPSSRPPRHETREGRPPPRSPRPAGRRRRRRAGRPSPRVGTDRPPPVLGPAGSSGGRRGRSGT